MILTPGTTPTHRFLIPYPQEDVASVQITYEQCGETILDKNVSTIDYVDAETCGVSVTLTQAESLRFSEGVECTVQANVLLASGGRTASEKTELSVGGQNKRSVIS